LNIGLFFDASIILAELPIIKSSDQGRHFSFFQGKTKNFKCKKSGFRDFVRQFPWKNFSTYVLKFLMTFF